MATTIDLIGVPCPLNWARAKARLECMRPGEILEITTDDSRALRDIPAAAEAEGYVVLEAAAHAGITVVKIEK